ncbi:MAG TPA: tetratricopeptide repeat protein, partial [Magnetococcales bacterium]|nr:tetratricopeptide repeat protein [Magnetococcales bacterium]
ATPCLAAATIHEALVSGAQSLGKEDLDQAIELFTQAIGTGSGSREQLAAAYEGRCASRYKKSLVENNKALTQEAIADCSRAMEYKSDHQRAYRLRGTAYLTTGDTPRALEDFNVAQALDPQDHLTLQNRGLALARSGQTEKAIADFDRAIKLKPGHSWSYYNRGRLYSAQGRHEVAIDDFSAFIRFRRDYEPAYLHRGRSWMATTSYQQALVDFYESLRLKPENNTEARFFRGVSLYLLERYDEAISDFEDVRRMDDGDIVNAMWLYIARERFGKPGREAFSGVRDIKEDAEWPGVMVAYMMDRSHAEAVLSAADKSENKGQPGETKNLALFFLGELAAIKRTPLKENTWYAKILEKPAGAPWVHAAAWQTRS